MSSMAGDYIREGDLVEWDDEDGMLSLGRAHCVKVGGDCVVVTANDHHGGPGGPHTVPYSALTLAGRGSA